MQRKQYQGVTLDDVESSYDVIVCGAGSSGSVVAGRLAAVDGLRVLLVEAGGAAPAELVDDPDRWPMALGSDLDWRFQAGANPELDGRAIPYSMGKALGGGSAINVATWSRGHRSDWDSFAAAAGDARWSYEAVLDLYRTKIEDWTGDADPALRGVGGRVRVQQAQQPSDFAHSILGAAEGAGLPRFSATNGLMMEASRGAALVEETVAGDRRRSIFDSYIGREPTASRLTVLTRTTVRQIRFDGDRATALDLGQNGRMRRIVADREIVLCCGAIKTPQILMLSGIGEERYLRTLGIDIKQPLSGVGRNLHDHVAFGCIWEATDLPMPTTPRSQTACFWTTCPDDETPDMYAYAARGAISSPEVLSAIDVPESAWTLLVGMTPKSRGRVLLGSPDPEAAPRIDAGYLGDPDDLRRLSEGLDTARAIGNSAELAAFTAREVLPSRLSSEEKNRFFRNSLNTFWHQCGTAAMGRSDKAVVDGDLRVYGIRNLRIADASVFPHVTVGNTMAPCCVVGERAAQLVLEAAGQTQ